MSLPYFRGIAMSMGKPKRRCLLLSGGGMFDRHLSAQIDYARWQYESVARTWLAKAYWRARLWWLERRIP